MALVIAVVAISFAAIFFRKADPTHPLVAAGVRLLVAAAVLAPFVARAARAGRLPGSVMRSALLAGLAYALHFGTWVTSLTMTSVAASVTLVTATPLMLAVVAIATGRDRPERRHWIAIGLALGGLALIGGADLANSEALLGDGLALLGAVAMAGYMLLVRRHGQSLDVWAFTGIATAVGGVALLGTATAIGVPIAFAGVSPFVYVLLAALIPQLVGHSLLTWALRHTRPTVVGIATVGEPVGSTLLGWLWLGETAGWATLAGCTITVGAVAMAVWQPRKKRPNPGS